MWSDHEIPNTRTRNPWSGAKTFRQAAVPQLVKAASVLLLMGIITVASKAADKSPRIAYGKQQDVVLATKLWRVLVARGLAGPDRINVHAFEGTEPHGSIQQIYKADVTVDGRRATVIVKANHVSADATVSAVYQTPNKYLAAYTVMFVNKHGYDPENKDWFWAKYEPDGAISRNSNGVAIAGRVGKIAAVGCIGCHKKIGGKDLETLTED
ncbi:MAG: hypothetical protein ACR2PA_08185 [Hyphomicrobiaceae bacterium]